MAESLALTRLPGESPCVFANGQDGHTTCLVHDWSGFKEQRSRVIVCPSVNDAARVDREGPGDAGLREALAEAVKVLAPQVLTHPTTGIKLDACVYIGTREQLVESMLSVAAALRAPVAGERGDDANRECATCGDPIYCPSCASEASR